MKKSKEANWSSGGSPLQFSSLKRLENVFVRSVIVIFFIIEKGFKMNAAKRFIGKQIVLHSALETSQKENNNGIPFTLTFHPHNHAVKSIILKKLQITSK